MYEAIETDPSSQFVRIPAATSRIDLLPQQTNPTRQIHGCGGRVVNQITKVKEVPPWIRLPSG